MTTLITGCDGFLGCHLVRRLAEDGRVTAFGRSVDPVTEAMPNVTVVPGDVRNRTEVDACISACTPDRIIHAASQGCPSVSCDPPQETFEVNVQGTAHVLESARKAVPDARILVFSSSSAYGPVASSAGIEESSPLLSQSLYGISKAACDWMSRLYAERYTMQVMVARPFNIVGPEMQGELAFDFARGLLRVEAGTSPCLRVGNLDAVRDFLPLEDALTACMTILNQGAAGEAYNICSGSGLAVRDLLESLLIHIVEEVRIEKDPALARPLDEPVRIGSCRKLRRLGWEPTQFMDQALKDLIESIRRSLKDVD